MSLTNRYTGVPVGSRLEQYQERELELQQITAQQQKKINELSTLVATLNEENEQQNLLISKLNAEIENSRNETMNFNKLSEENLNLKISLDQTQRKNTMLVCKVNSLEKRPPTVVTKSVEVVKEVEKCQECKATQLEKEKQSLSWDNGRLSRNLEEAKGINKLLMIFGAVATFFSIYRNESVLSELKPILNCIVSIYSKYDELARVSLLSTNAIGNTALKVLAIIGVVIAVCGVSSALVGLVAYLMGEYVAPFIEDVFDDVATIVCVGSLSVVVFAGGELKAHLPTVLSSMNIFLLWLILFVVFLIGKRLRERYYWGF